MIIRHPEKINKPVNPIKKKPRWIRSKLINNQVVYNIIQRGIEIEILPQAVAENIAITTYGPLAMGVLSGKYRLGSPVPVDSRGSSSAPIITWLSEFSESIDRFIQFAEDKNVHPVALAIAWVRSSNAVTSPIVGVSSLSQFETAISAFDYNMTQEERKTISEIFSIEFSSISGEILRIIGICDLKLLFSNSKRTISCASK